MYTFGTKIEYAYADSKIKRSIILALYNLTQWILTEYQ